MKAKAVKKVAKKVETKVATPVVETKVEAVEAVKETVTVAEAASFIQKKKESYIKTFLDAKVNNRKPKFNVSAFLFGPLWFFFRKIYKRSRSS